MNNFNNNINGLVILDKPKDFTSNDCIQIIKKTLNVKKIGHIGTLDYNATGVLVCLLGKATKSQDYLMKYGDKVYSAELILGFSTDTEDFLGRIINTTDIDTISIDKEFENKLLSIINSFIGEYNQIPPMYSSKKVNGAKLLNLARKGKEIERKPCSVYIKSISINGIRKDYINSKNVIIADIIVTCSKGTYIRTLCKDIGDKISICACMGNLRRLRVSEFRIEEAISLDDLKDKASNNDFSFIRPCLYKEKDSVVTFGKFETLHLGHELIIKEVVNEAKMLGLESTVLMIGNNVDDRLLTYEQKISKLDFLGVDNILEFPFNEYTKNMEATEFIKKILVNQLKAKVVVVGTDCRFGKNGLGNTELLIGELNKIDIKVIILNKLKVSNKDIDISSTYIKEEYNKGNIEIVNRLLGKEVNI